MDARMTPAQVARRKFKSTLPRKFEGRTVFAMQALGEMFTLLDQFRSCAREAAQNMDAAKAIYAAVAYSLPNDAKLAFTSTVPEPGEKIGPFCDAMIDLENPIFLGVVFVQVDPAAKKAEHRAVSFVVPFKTDLDSIARLRYAQSVELIRIKQMTEQRGTA
jgi:hypothetical protein